jgi:CRISPR/Cas system CMR subunit Cmr4 (Cas7 group RAMP superfamily)
VVAEVDFDDEEDEEDADIVPFFDLALLLSPSSSILKSLVWRACSWFCIASSSSGLSFFLLDVICFLSR